MKKNKKTDDIKIEDIAEQWARLVLANIEAKKRKDSYSAKAKNGSPEAKNSLIY